MSQQTNPSSPNTTTTLLSVTEANVYLQYQLPRPSLPPSSSPSGLMTKAYIEPTVLPTPYPGMREVWRVEWADTGEGPYNPFRRCDFAYDSDHYRPTPQQEGLDFVLSPFWHCGFASLSSYCSWFGASSRRLLDAAGYILSLYHAKQDDVKEGKAQVLFLRHKARYVSAFSPLIPDFPTFSSLPRPLWVDADTPHTVGT